MAAKKDRVRVRELVKATLAIAIITAVAGYLLNRFYFKPLPETYIEVPPNIPELAIHRSNMGFSVIAPKSYEITESEDEVVFATEEGEIRIARDVDFVRDNFVTRKNLDVNGVDMVRGFVNRKRMYVVDAPQGEFIISTSQETLYDELDLLALSFKVVN